MLERMLTQDLDALLQKMRPATLSAIRNRWPAHIVISWLLNRHFTWEITMRARALLTALLVALGFSSLALTACNTAEGFGQDVQKAGQSIEHKADESK